MVVKRLARWARACMVLMVSGLAQGQQCVPYHPTYSSGWYGKVSGHSPEEVCQKVLEGSVNPYYVNGGSVLVHASYVGVRQVGPNGWHCTFNSRSVNARTGEPVPSESGDYNWDGVGKKDCPVPVKVTVTGASQAWPKDAGGAVLRLIASLTQGGAAKAGASISLSIQGEAGGSVVALGASDASGNIQLDYTPPQSLVGASKLDRIRVDCAGCENSAHHAILIQGTPTQGDEEAGEDPGQCTRHPIVATSGVKTYAEQDLVDAAAHPLSLSRRYASRWDVGPAAGLGHEWTHSHAHRVVVLGREAIVQHGDGATSRFVNVAPGYSVDPAVGGGGWSCAPGAWCTPLYTPPAQQPPAQWQAQGQVQGSGDTLLEVAGGYDMRRASDDSHWLFDKATGQALSWRQRNGWTWQYSYTGGRLTRVTNAFGRVLHLSYDAQGRLVGASGPGGQVSYGHDAQGRLSQVVQADGASRRYLYEDARWPGAITAVVNEAGVRYNSVAYDAQGRAIRSELAGGADRTQISYGVAASAITDALNTTRHYQYQALAGRGPRTTQASTLAADGNPIAAQSLDAQGLLQSRTDFLGITTLYTWDAGRRLRTAQTRAAGRAEEQTTQTQWHPTYRLPTLVTEAGRTRVYTYDAQGNRLSETLTDSATGQARTWTWDYDERGLVASVTLPDGGQWRYVNGPLGLPVKVINPLGHERRYQHDAAGRVTRILQASLAEQHYEYDARGRLVTAIVGPKTTRYTWSATGQLQSVQEPGGYQVTYSYDAAQRLVGVQDNRGNRVAYTLDALGNRVREEVRDATGAMARVTARTVNGLNQLMAMHGAAGQTTQLGYDANGQLVNRTDGLNHTTRQTRDGLGRTVAHTFADNAAASQHWNALNQLAQVTDPKGVATRYTYNAFGETLSETSADAGTLSYERDASGRVVKQTDARGQISLITRDALGRPVHISRGAQQTYYRWDTQRAGYLAQVEDASGSIDYRRDPQGRVVQRIQRVNDNPANPSSFTTHYGYAGGELAVITYPSGLKVSYTRDATGQIVGVDLQPAGGAQTPFVSELRHTALGQPRSWRWRSGAQASRTFDADGRMTANETASYAYDAAGRITGITQQLWASTAAASTASLYLTPLSWTVDYDSRDRITGFVGSTGQARYSYDANGNRLSVVEATHSDVDLEGEFSQPNVRKTDTRTLNVAQGSNRLLGFGQQQGVVIANRMGSTARASVTYALDAAGNLTGDGLRKFDYDEANRMSKVRVFKDGEEATVRYLHNALGQRVFQGEPQASTTLPNQQTLGQGFIDWLKSRFGWMFQQQATTSIGTAYVYGDGPLPSWAILGDYDNGSASGTGRSEYIWLPTPDGAIPVGMYRNGKLYAIHTDHQGAPRLMKDERNKPVWQWPYSAFGGTEPTGILQATPKTPMVGTTQSVALKKTPPAQDLTMRYPGQMRDAETGTNQGGWRNYEAKHRGGYIQMDPIGLDGGLNRTVYGYGNALMNTDPDGRFVVPAFLPLIPLVPVACYLSPGCRDLFGPTWAESASPLDPSGSAGHDSGARESTRGKHEEGDARRKRDRGGEDGDDRRDWPRKKPDGWKGPWPPKPKSACE